MGTPGANMEPRRDQGVCRSESGSVGLSRDFLADLLSRNFQTDRREDHFRRLGLSLADSRQAEVARARIVFSEIHAARKATTMGQATAAFRFCGLFPHSPAPGLAELVHPR
jgi:hypothetical protein